MNSADAQQAWLAEEVPGSDRPCQGVGQLLLVKIEAHVLLHPQTEVQLLTVPVAVERLGHGVELIKPLGARVHLLLLLDLPNGLPHLAHSTTRQHGVQGGDGRRAAVLVSADGLEVLGPPAQRSRDENVHRMQKTIKPLAAGDWVLDKVQQRALREWKGFVNC